MTLVPHPDDEALGCAGTLLHLQKMGVTSSLVFLTNGEKLYEKPSQEIAKERKKEGRISSAMLGCRDPLFLDFPDGEIGGHGEKIYQTLHRLIEERKPHLILSPSPIDYHPDHIATAHIALRLLNTFHFFLLAFYEVYSTLRFNYLVDITEVSEEKKRIILNYHTSLCEKPGVYANAALGLNAQRSIFVQREGYYEAFYIVEKNGDLGKIRNYLSYTDLDT
jgi:N-acetylglucosamine malate deacetylase 1